MKACKKHLSQQQDLQQQQQRNSCSEIRKPVVWEPYRIKASVGTSSGDFTEAMPSLPQSSRPSRERFRGRSASLARLHCDGQPDTAEEPRFQPAHLAAFSTFSYILCWHFSTRGTIGPLASRPKYQDSRIHLFLWPRFIPFPPHSSLTARSIPKSQTRERLW